MKIQIYCDSADLQTIKKLNKSSLVKGFTTIIEKVSKFGKTYQELTLDTVKKFLKDSRDSNFKI